MAEKKKYYWLKLKDDFFNNREIKKLRRVSGGDTFTIIYLKMQLLSIKQDGLINYLETEENLAEQLSLELDEAIEDVKLTLAFLQSNALIENISKDEYLLNKVPELIGSETSAAERMRKMRNCNNVTPLLQNVTQREREEIDIEKEKDKDKKKDKKKDYAAAWKDFVNSKGEDFKIAWKSFMDFRKGKKGKDTDYALYLLTRDLQKFSLIEEEQIEIINNSLKGKWTGIYALKNKQAPSKKTETYGGER